MVYFYKGKQVCKCCENCIGGGRVYKKGLNKIVSCFTDGEDKNPLDYCKLWDFSEDKFNCIKE